MKTAVIGSRDITNLFDLSPYLPEGTTEIVSGGARGVDTCARSYAQRNNIKLTEFLPDYATHGKSAPHIRNDQIIDYADCVIAFWNKKSRGTKSVIDKCKKLNKKVIVYVLKDNV